MRRSGVGRRRSQISARSGRGQQGSALLIVFVFAAMVAIMLYTEMPVVVFEAKRQKEQLLIDRGNEYAHAVKLYVRKFGMYPTSIDQLENTNRMRFLRARYKDPFTGKDNWRMLHAGPGGMLTDSKVKPQGTNSNGTGAGSNSGFGSGTGTGSGSSNASASSGFGSSGFGSASSSSSSSADTVVVPDIPQRPPAIPANGGAAMASASGEPGSAAEGEQSPTASLLPAGQMAAAEQGEPGASENAGQSAGQNGGATAQNGATGQSAAAGGSDSQNAMNTMRQALGNAGGGGNPQIGAPLGGSNTTGATSTMGQIAGGGIAGVASVAKGHSIKVVNDQTDYSLWEFYYDPTKDATKNLPGLANGQAGQQPGANGANTSQAGQSIFGPSNSITSSPMQSTTGTPNAGVTAPQPTIPPQ
jgi:hypothetical protein